MDHIVPLCSGGADSPENMQLLTKRQHREKNTRGFAAVPENEEKGNGGSPWVVPSNQKVCYNFFIYNMVCRSELLLQKVPELIAKRPVR